MSRVWKGEDYGVVVAAVLAGCEFGVAAEIPCGVFQHLLEDCYHPRTGLGEESGILHEVEEDAGAAFLDVPGMEDGTFLEGDGKDRPVAEGCGVAPQKGDEGLGLAELRALIAAAGDEVVDCLRSYEQILELFHHSAIIDLSFSDTALLSRSSIPILKKALARC